MWCPWSPKGEPGSPVLLLRQFKFYGIALEAVKWNKTCLVGVPGYAAGT